MGNKQEEKFKMFTEDKKEWIYMPERPYPKGWRFDEEPGEFPKERGFPEENRELDIMVDIEFPNAKHQIKELEGFYNKEKDIFLIPNLKNFLKVDLYDERGNVMQLSKSLVRVIKWRSKMTNKQEDSFERFRIEDGSIIYACDNSKIDLKKQLRVDVTKCNIRRKGTFFITKILYKFFPKYDKGKRISVCLSEKDDNNIIPKGVKIDGDKISFTNEIYEDKDGE